MRKKILVVSVILLVVMIGYPVIQGVLSPEIVSANPVKPPPGKTEESKWVQNKNTGKCMWLPENAVAHPWVVVPEGTCPTILVVTVVQVQATPTLIITVLPTPTFIQPRISQPTATLDPNDNILTMLSTDTPTPEICDLCLEQRGIRKALEAIATGLAH